MKFASRFLVIGSFALIGILPSRAANTTVDNYTGGTTDWQTATNWSVAVPSANYTAELATSANLPVLYANSSADAIWVTGANLTKTETITSNSTAETLTLTGQGNTVTGAAGTFAIQIDDTPKYGLTIGSTTAANNVNLSLLNSTSFNITVGATLTVDGTITNGGTAPIILTLSGANTSATDTLNGIISNGTGTNTTGIDVTTTGTAKLLAANTYTGTTEIDAGTLDITTMANGGTASGIGASTNVAGNLIFGGGQLEYTGTVAGSTDHLVTVGDASGSLAAFNASATSTAATMSFTNTGAVVYGGSSSTHTLNFTGSNLGENVFDLAIGDGTGATSVERTTGAGLWVLNGTNTYSGATTIFAGSLEFGQETSLYDDNTANWTAANLIVKSGATLAFGVGGAGQFTSSDITNILAIGGTTSNGFENGSNIGFDSTGGNFIFTGNIPNANVGYTLGVTIFGSNTVTLSGTANTYSGTTTVNSGTLAAGAANAFGQGPLSVVGGTVDLSSYNDTANTTVTLNGGTIESTGGGALNATTAYTLEAGTISAPLTGSATVTKTTTGQVTLSGTDTYSQPTTISQGILEFSTEASLYNDNSAAWIPANLLVSSGATLALGVGGTGQFTSSDVSTFLANMASSSANTGLESGSLFALDATNAPGGTFSYTGNSIADTSAGPLIFSTVGTGTVSLPNANTYSGGTVLEAGSTISVGNNSSLGSGTITMGQATTTGNANFTSSAPVTLANALSIYDVTFTGTNSLAFSGAVTDAAFNSNAAARYLTNNLSGGATLTFSNSIFTLGTSTAAAANYAFSGSGTTIIDGALTGTSSGNGSGFVYTGTGMIELESTNSSVIPTGYNYIGANLTGVGTVREDASNALGGSASAAMKLYSGTLELNTNVIQIINTGGLQMGGDGTTTGGVGSTANVLLESGSVLELNAGLTYNPTTTGSVPVAIGQATISGPGTVDLYVPSTGTAAANRTFAVTASTGTGGGPDLVISSAIANGNSYANGIIKNGSGILQLTAANTYTGTTTVSAGTLQVDGSIGGTVANPGGAVSVNAGTLSGIGTVNGVVTISSGSFLAPGTVGTAGTLTLTNGLTWNAGATIEFDLGSNQATSDLLTVDTNLSPGTGTGNFTFAFNNIGTITPGTQYTLITGFSGGTFTASNFTATGDSGTFSMDANDLYFTIASVPEASTNALFLGGLLALGLFMRRRLLRATDDAPAASE